MGGIPSDTPDSPNIRGCIKALLVNGIIQDLLQAGTGVPGVHPRCEDTCAAYPCQNDGICRQFETEFECLCTGSFFTGKTCSQGELQPCDFCQKSKPISFSLQRDEPISLFTPTDVPLLFPEMNPVRFNPGASLSYTVYSQKIFFKDDLNIKFKTTSSDGGLAQIQTRDPNQFIKLLIKNKVLSHVSNSSDSRVGSFHNN